MVRNISTDDEFNYKLFIVQNLIKKSQKTTKVKIITIIIIIILYLSKQSHFKVACLQVNEAISYAEHRNRDYYGWRNIQHMWVNDLTYVGKKDSTYVG